MTFTACGLEVVHIFVFAPVIQIGPTLLLFQDKAKRRLDLQLPDWYPWDILLNPRYISRSELLCKVWTVINCDLRVGHDVADRFVSPSQYPIVQTISAAHSLQLVPSFCHRHFLSKCHLNPTCPSSPIWPVQRDLPTKMYCVFLATLSAHAVPSPKAPTERPLANWFQGSQSVLCSDWPFLIQ
jgi:hypothetical protein